MRPYYNFFMFTDLKDFLQAKSREDRKVYTYVKALFRTGSYGYTYLCDGDVQEGDMAVVTVSNEKKAVFVSAVSYGTSSEAPYPFEKLRFVDEVARYGTPRHLELLCDFAGATPVPEEELYPKIIDDDDDEDEYDDDDKDEYDEEYDGDGEEEVFDE